MKRKDRRSDEERRELRKEARRRNSQRLPDPIDNSWEIEGVWQSSTQSFHVHSTPTLLLHSKRWQLVLGRQFS